MSSPRKYLIKCYKNTEREGAQNALRQFSARGLSHAHDEETDARTKVRRVVQLRSDLPRHRYHCLALLNVTHASRAEGHAAVHDKMVPFFRGVDHTFSDGRLHPNPRQNVVAERIEICIALKPVGQAVFPCRYCNDTTLQSHMILSIYPAACSACAHSFLSALSSAAEVRALDSFFNAKAARQAAIAFDLSHTAVIACSDRALLALDHALVRCCVVGVVFGCSGTIAFFHSSEVIVDKCWDRREGEKEVVSALEEAAI
jgi:hypothetical protein